MARLQEALMQGAFESGTERPILNLQKGGGAWAMSYLEWSNNQAYVSRPLIPILLEAPRLFTVLPSSEKWIGSLKALIEQHARSIDGLEQTLTVDTDSHPFGGAGEEFEEFVNVTRARSTIRFSFVEKYGRPIQTLLDYWIRYGMMDPETKFALIGTLAGDVAEDLLVDWYTMTCLFIVPDPIHKNVDKAWLVTNMFPKGTGDITAKRDLTTSQEILNLDIEFTGISQVGLGVNQLAKKILDQINITNADPFFRKAFIEDVSGDVSAAADNGYKKYTEDVGSEAVTSISG